VKTKKKPVGALAGWFGGDRLIAPTVGESLAGCQWVGIPFAGGMAAVLHIDARTILVNDKHRHVINLARVVADGKLRPRLIAECKRRAFHPAELLAAQLRCRGREAYETNVADLDWAVDYFITCWMGRASRAGSKDEFTGRTATRWNANGGDSVVRYFSAIRGLVPFGRCLRRCTFETMDGIDFVDRSEDNPGNGLYVDAPWPRGGRDYKFNPGQTDAEERIWHTRLRDSLMRFERTRLVVRFGEHPLITELYPETEWTWRRRAGRDQANNDAPEMLLLRNMPRSERGLFGG
jgi:DNA adenine methylase